MDDCFCANFYRYVEEDIIGSATNYQTYILIECPLSWAPEAFDSRPVPQNLKNLVAEVNQQHLSIRFILISSDKSEQTNSTNILIFEQKKERLSQDYQKHKFNVETIEEVADFLRKYLAGEVLDCESNKSTTRDILVFTPGSHEQCYTRYGIPFYRQALATVAELSLSNVRIWKSRYFGAHGSAPTIIDFPEGRYYGALDAESFRSILMRTGNIKCLNRVYRGWGLLPIPLQIMERELILSYGWNWFNYKVAGRMLEPNSDNPVSQGEITLEKPDGSIYTYQAEIVKNQRQIMQITDSCNNIKESNIINYLVENIKLCIYYEPLQNAILYSGKIAG